MAEAFAFDVLDRKPLAVNQYELREQLKADQHSDPALRLQRVALPVKALQFLAERPKRLDLLHLADLVEGEVQIVQACEMVDTFSARDAIPLQV